MLSTATEPGLAPEPIECRDCRGAGGFCYCARSPRCPGAVRGHGEDCRRCKGTGHEPCEECGEAATRTAIGDSLIALCATCGEASDRDFAVWAAGERVTIEADDEDRSECSLADFLEANAETLAPEDIEALIHKGRLVLGGGAAPLVLITRKPRCSGCVARPLATRRCAYDVADVCDDCGERSDHEKAAHDRHEKRLAAMEVI